jgi:O-antigen ligase
MRNYGEQFNKTELWKRRNVRFQILILLSFFRVVIPTFLDTFLNGRTNLQIRSKQVDNAIDYQIQSNLYSQVQSAFTVILIAYCIYLIILYLLSGSFTINWLYFIIIILFFLSIYLQVMNDSYPRFQIVLFPLILLCSILLRPDFSSFRIVSVAIIIVSIISLALRLVSPDIVLVNYGSLQSKGIFGYKLLSGIYSHSNQFGAVLSLSAPFILLLKRNAQIVFLPLILLTLFLTGSRSALLATALSLMLMWSLRNFSDKAFNLTVTCVFYSGMVVMYVLPFLIRSENFLSLRGRIWMRSIEDWKTNPIFGMGSDYYENTALNYSTIGYYGGTGHNLALDFLVKYGILGLAMISIILITMRNRAVLVLNLSRVPALWILTFLLNGIVEVNFNPMLLNQTAFITFAMLGYILSIQKTK